MEEVEEELSLLSNLVNIEIGRREKRPICDNCSRPAGVCWCQGLGGQQVHVRSRVVVLQHPHEEKRCLRTAPILRAALPPQHYLELKGKRFSLARNPELFHVLSSGYTILMYPGEGAKSVEELPRVGESVEDCNEGGGMEGDGGGGGGGGCHEGSQTQPPYNIIILDGTWQQAKSIFHNCPCLHALPQVCLSGRYTSEYIIRTQPTDDALSTVETAALALAILEGDWSIYDTLVEPLRVLCRYQLSHGAVPHQSKEHMLVSGRCHRPLGKRTYKKLKKCGARYPQALAALLMGGGNGGGDGGDGVSGDNGDGGDETGRGSDMISVGKVKLEGEEEVGSVAIDEEKQYMEKSNDGDGGKGIKDENNEDERMKVGKGGSKERKEMKRDEKAGRGEGEEEEEEEEEKGMEESGQGGGGGGGERKDREKEENDDCVLKVKRNISSHIPWELR